MEEGGFTDYRVNKWLKDMKSLYIGLHYANPNVSGAYASEVFGGSYARVLATFSEPDGRVIFNESTLTFRGMPSVKITHISGWDDQYSGNMEIYIPLTEPFAVQAGKSYEIQASMLAISLP